VSLADMFVDQSLFVFFFFFSFFLLLFDWRREKRVSKNIKKWGRDDTTACVSPFGSHRPLKVQMNVIYYIRETAFFGGACVDVHLPVFTMRNDDGDLFL
jgi:hypothetical protein